MKGGLRAWLLGLIALLVVIALALWAILPGRQHAKVMDEAFLALGEDDEELALDRAEAAFQLDRNSVEGRSLLARLLNEQVRTGALTEEENEQLTLRAVELYRGLVREGSASDEDFVALIQILQGMGELDESMVFISDGRALYPQNADLLALLARQVLLAEEDAAKALEYSQAALDIDPNNTRGLIIRGILLSRTGAVIDRIQAKEALMLAGRDPSHLGMEALVSMLYAEGLLRFAEDFTELADLFEDHPSANPETNMWVYRLRHRAQPDRQEALVEMAIEDLSETNLGGLARWLSSLGEYQRVLDLIDFEEHRQDTALLELRLQALDQLQRRDEARAMMRDEETALTPAMRDTYLALFPEEDLPENELRNRWRVAFESSLEMERWVYVVELGRTAGARGFFEDAREAYEAVFASELAERAPEQLWQEYLVATLQTRDAEAAYAVTNAHLERFENSPLATNNRAYLSFLLNQDVTERIEEIRQLVETFPNETSFANTYALGLYRVGQLEEAFELLEGRIANWEALSPSDRVVLALILNENLQPTRARRIAETVQPDDVLDEEYALIADIASRGPNS